MTGEAFGNKRPDKKWLISALTNNLHIFQGLLFMCIYVCVRSDKMKSCKLTVKRQCLCILPFV